MGKILIFANALNTVLLFRKELIEELSRKGNNITVVIPQSDSEQCVKLESYGCNIVFNKISRRGMNPLKDLGLFCSYLKIIKKIKPDIILTYTVKPNIYGSLAGRIKKILVIANVTGLGSAFQSETGFLRKFVSFLYKISLKTTKKVFFENEGNKAVMINEKIIKESQAVVVHGAGVNLCEYDFREYPTDNIKTTFLFSGRIMKDKGVDELFEAIKKIMLIRKNVEFNFIGFSENCYQEKVDEMVSEGSINFYGYQTNVKKFIENAHCIVLPSYHEGMSNTLLEAAAMGRPLITTNIHGCLEAVNNEKNGYLCNVKSVQSLYEKLLKFIDLPYEEKKEMGIQSRIWMEEYFDKKCVVETTVEIIEDVLSTKS